MNKPIHYKKYIRNTKLIISFLVSSVIILSGVFYHLNRAEALVAITEPVSGVGTGGGGSSGSGIITLKLWSVVCNTEPDLPNLNLYHSSYNPSTGARNTGGLVIDEGYINNWVASHPNCTFDDGWSFRWGPGEGFPPTWTGWTNTNTTSNGLTVAYVPATALDKMWVQDYNTPWAPDYNITEQRIYVSMLRGPGAYSDQWKIDKGSYVPADYVDIAHYDNPPNPFPQNMVSSEFWCYDNHATYDNYEYVRYPVGGGTYSCVLFTAYNNPATVKVDSSECPVANWFISNDTSSRTYSGSGGQGGTYVGRPGTYTLASVGVPSGYDYTISNSDGNSSPSMPISGGQTKTFTIKCPKQVAAELPSVNLTVNGLKSVQVNKNESATLSWTTKNVVSNGCSVNGGWTGTRDSSGSESTGSLTQSYIYGITCRNVDGKEASDSVSVKVADTPDPLPPCTVDSFNDQWENNGWVYPTWSTSLSNNVVLSGGQFGSGVAVEPDGQRTINIDSDTTLTITANAGASCSPSASKSAVMHAEATAMCTVSGLEYLPATDPNCKPPVPSCSFVNPYSGGDGFPDFTETGDGQTPIMWYSNADSLTLSGGPYSNYPVSAPNSNGYFYFPNITANTTVMLSGNNGMCTNSSILYAAPVPPKPTPFSATAQACGTRTINLSWGEAPGSYNYKVFSNGNEIYSGPEWNPYGWKIISDTNLIPGETYSYSVIGQSPNGNTEPNTVTAVAPIDCPNPPNVILNVNPQNVPYNGTTNITWSTTGADSCTASGGWSGSRATQSPVGGVTSPNLTANTTFTLTCTGPGGTGSDSKTVIVGSGNQSDLRPYAPSTDTATVGTALFFSGSIVNIGTGSTVNSFKNFFQLANDYDGGGTYTDLAPVTMDPLDASASKQSDSPYYTFTSTGRYSIRICADKSSRNDLGTIDELNEDNNCSGWTNVIVNPSGPAFDYTLSRSSGTVSITQGTSDSNTIYKNLTSGVGSAVDLDISGLPSGSGVSVSYVNRTCAPDCSSTIIFEASSTAPPGTYNITVTGSPLNKTTSFTLLVNSTSALSVTCKASQAPGGNKINQPVIWSANASGGSGTYNSWSWSGTNIPTSPAPAVNPYSITYTTTGTKVARATVTDSNGNQATCPDATTVISFDPNIIEF